MSDRALHPTSPFTPEQLQLLEALRHRFPTVDAALAEIAALLARLTLPKGTVHVVSDVHGEFKKLKHVINNASGSLRPLVEQLFGDRLTEAERVALLGLIYYPRESYDLQRPTLHDEGARRAFLRRVLPQVFEVLRALAPRYGLPELDAVFPSPYEGVFRELLFAPALERADAYIDALVEPFLRVGKDADLLRLVSRAVRNLSIAELIVAGDLGDRGPRIDRVIDYLMHQPNVAITWGNHDASWMGACLGQPACIAIVLRISLRYGRIAQLEEGYGIPVEPLEQLARAVYGDDPASRFHVKGEDLREPLLLARMQKAIAIIQFKLEGQAARRNPHFNLDHRDLLHRIDMAAGTVEIDGARHPLLDTAFPTLDRHDPYALSPEERACMAALTQSFLESPVLWQQMRFVARRGSMYALRDDHAIFHGCIPVAADGSPLPLDVDGIPRRGRALFDALNVVVQRAFRTHQPSDLDMLWYLWTGPLSPCFGKDKMATFEGYFVADKELQKETKNPYFKLIHEQDFCRSVLRELGADPDRGLIVNGHVPVKLEQGENPVKKSGMAVTIDGAFSEAYGDRGYTLVLDANRTYLAQHHHFESISAALTTGADIIPTTQVVHAFERPRIVADTDGGVELRQHIDALELLVRAYQDNVLQERAPQGLGSPRLSVAPSPPRPPLGASRRGSLVRGVHGRVTGVGREGSSVDRSERLDALAGARAGAQRGELPFLAALEARSQAGAVGGRRGDLPGPPAAFAARGAVAEALGGGSGGGDGRGARDAGRSRAAVRAAPLHAGDGGRLRLPQAGRRRGAARRRARVGEAGALAGLRRSGRLRGQRGGQGALRAGGLQGDGQEARQVQGRRREHHRY
jgi:fructose-1,6-bisphosphatase III